MAQRRRVVITGLGLATPNGTTLESNFHALLQDRDCFSLFPLSLEDPQRYWGSEVCSIELQKEYDIPDRMLKNANEVCRYAIYAAKRAMDDASLSPEWVKYDDLGVFIGLGQELMSDEFIDHLSRCCFDEQGAYSFESIARREINSFNIVRFLKDYSIFPLSFITIAAGLRGPSSTFCNGATSGGVAVGEANSWIRCHRNTDALLAGATSFPFRRYIHAFFGKKGFLSAGQKDEGLILANGSVFFVLEELEHARKRDARIYGEILGSSSCTAYQGADFTNLGSAGYELLIHNALAEAELDIDDLDFISTSSFCKDIIHPEELRALQAATRNSKKAIPLASYKTKTGHLMAAAQPYDLAMDLAVIKRSVLPGMTVLSDRTVLPDRNDIDFADAQGLAPVIGQNLNGNFHRGMSLCADPSGNYSAIIVGRYDG